MKRSLFLPYTLLLLLAFSCQSRPEYGIDLVLGIDGKRYLLELAGHQVDAALRDAVQTAQSKQHLGETSFPRVFGEALQAKGLKLAPYFATEEQKLPLSASDEEVVTWLEKQFDAALEANLEVLKKRVERLPGLFIEPKESGVSGQLSIRLVGTSDRQLARQITCQMGRFRVWEVPEQQHGILNGVNEAINVALAVPDITITDSMRENWSDKERLQNYHQQNPLFALIQFMQQTETVEAPLGYVKVEDTAEVNRMLNLHQIKTRYSRINFRWMKKPTFVDIQAHGLVAIQKPLSGISPLGGEFIASSYTRRSSETGFHEIVLELNEEGSQVWAHFTKKNVDRPIAMELDGYIVSAPSVAGPISDGSVPILGNFDQAEAETLAAILSGGTLAAPMLILEEENWGKVKDSE